MSDPRRRLTPVLALGAAACAACCAGPILAFLGGLALAGLASTFVIGVAGLVVAGLALAAFVIVRQRRADAACPTARAAPVPVASPSRKADR
jgi:hypothetical protein